MSKNKDKEIESKPNKKGRFFRVLKRICIAFFVFFVISSIIIISLAQTYSFRHKVLSEVLSLVNKSLLGKVYVDDITFYSLNGIQINKVKLLADGDTVVSLDKLTLDISYENLLNNHAVINRIIIDNPNFKLLRNTKDSLWNINKIAPASSDTSTSKTDWMISVANLEIKGGKFTMYDSLSAQPVSRGTINYSKMKIENLNLRTMAEIRLVENDFKAEITGLSAKETFSGFKIDKMEMKAHLSPKEISIEKVNFRHNLTELAFDASIKKFNLFGTPEEAQIDKAAFKIDLKAYDFNPDLIYYFAPLSLKIGGRHDVKVAAEGTLNNLTLDYLNVKTGNTDLILNGKLYNLLIPGSLNYKIHLGGSYVKRKDINPVLPQIAPNIPEFGTAEIRQMFVDGGVDSVYTEMNIKTSIGRAKGKAEIGFGRFPFSYKVDIVSEGLDLEPLVRNSALKSSLNGHILLKGTGITPDDVRAELEMNSKISYLNRFPYEKMLLKASIIAKDTINIDTLALEVLNKNIDPSKESYYKQTGTLFLNGGMNIQNMSLPSYRINAVFDALDLISLTENAVAPKYMSGSLELIGEGLEPDSIQGVLSANINEMLLQDKSLLPFELYAEISRNGNNRDFNVFSDFFDFSIEGKYTLTGIINAFTNQGVYLSSFINDKIKAILPQEFNEAVLSPRSKGFPDIDCKINADIKDISPVMIFVKDFRLSSGLKLRTNLKSTVYNSKLEIDTLIAEGFNMSVPGTQVKAAPVFMSGDMNLSVIDSMITLDKLKLNFMSTGNLDINSLLINNPDVKLTFDGKNLEFIANTFVNSEIGIKAAGRMIINDTYMNLLIDSTKLLYKDMFLWTSKSNIDISINRDGIAINSFILNRENAETISASGIFTGKEYENIKLNIKDLPLKDALAFLPPQLQNQFAPYSGNIRDISINADGKTEYPVIQASMQADSIMYNKFLIGNLSASLLHDGKGITGSAFVQNQEKTKIVDIAVNSLPIYLGIDSTQSFFIKDKKLDIKVFGGKIPVQLAAPFIPNISEVNGYADAQLSVYGTLPEDIMIKGKADFENLFFLLNNTNVNYIADGSIEIDEDLVDIKNINIRNVSSDLKDGSANVTGTVTLDNFTPGYLDIVIESKKLLVLNDASQKSMPNIYGRFVIATEARPLRFFGTMDKPNLEGDVFVISGDLKMPEQSNALIRRTSFTYKVKGNVKQYQFKTESIDSAAFALQEKVKSKEKNETGANIADLINYDLNIRMNRISALIDLGTLGEVYAKIGTRDPSVPIRYVKKRTSPDAKLYGGDISLLEGSTVKVFRIMTASGTISFPTGKIDNPSLDLKAVYNGKMNEGNSVTNFTVYALVGGTKLTPTIRLTYALNGVDAAGDSKQIEEDAFLLLTTGRTKNSAGSFNNSNLVNQGVNMGISQVASKSLTDLLLGTGVIQSADIKFDGQGLENAQVNLSGQLFGVASWTIGGSVGDLADNNIVSIDIPFSVNSEALNSFILQISKATNINSTVLSQDAKNWEVKIKFGGSW